MSAEGGSWWWERLGSVERKELGTARREMEVRWERSAVRGVAVERRAVNWDKSGKVERRAVMLSEKDGVGDKISK